LLGLGLLVDRKEVALPCRRLTIFREIEQERRRQMFAESTERFWAGDARCSGDVSRGPPWQVGFKYWDSILQLERNPFCVYLIELGNGDSDIFLRAKTSGTLTVLSVLAALHRKNRRLAYAVTAAVSVFQLALLVYLTVR
jgi:hypothetical protein